MPQTNSGRLVLSAIASMSKPDVLLASKAPGFIMPSNFAKNFFLKVQVFINRLDHNICLVERVKTVCRLNERHYADPSQLETTRPFATVLA